VMRTTTTGRLAVFCERINYEIHNHLRCTAPAFKIFFCLHGTNYELPASLSTLIVLFHCTKS
jgi:hypothetical protein